MTVFLISLKAGGVALVRVIALSIGSKLIWVELDRSVDGVHDGFMGESTSGHGA